jgi:hypothetical protein
MSKSCNFIGCKYRRFGGGYCKNHQYVRPLKKPKEIKKRKPIRKVSKNQQAILGERANLTKKDRLFFAEIWEERDHVDFETGAPIYGEPLTLYFHHVLAKRPTAYPQFRYEKWNIIIVNGDTHTLAEANKWKKIPKIAAYREDLLKKYT